MSLITMFYGIIIQMQFNEHNPPHIHARYQGYEASFELDGTKLRGEFPKKQAKLVEAWCVLHNDELVADWDLMRDAKAPLRIEPLK